MNDVFKIGDVIVRIGSFDRFRVQHVDDKWYYAGKNIVGKWDSTYFIDVEQANAQYVKVGYDASGLHGEGQDVI